jgi:hypothetical protein
MHVFQDFEAFEHQWFDLDDTPTCPRFAAGGVA